MALPTLARKWSYRFLKVALYTAIMIGCGRALGNPEIYVNHDFADWVCNILYDDVNAETIYDTYFYIDFVTVIAITTAIYILTVKLIKQIRRK